MLNEALKCLTVELNEYLRNKHMLGSDARSKVLLSGLVDQAGQVAIQEENTIVVTLVNIEEERVSKSYSLSNNRTSENVPQPLAINLYILLSSYFATTNYGESLKFLSLAISFFQEKNVFTPANSPSLNSTIEKISVEMVSLSIEKLNNLWATLGAKYMPSVLYKMRMLTFTNTDLQEYRPLITATNERS